MSDFGYEQHDEYRRENRGRGRFRGRRPYRPRGNGSGGYFQQNSWTDENSAWGADDAGDGSGNLRGRGRQRPRGNGSGSYYFQRNSWTDENSAWGADDAGDGSGNLRGRGRQRPRGNGSGSYFQRNSWNDENSAWGADDAGDGSGNLRGQGKQRPRGRGRHWGRGRGNGFTTSDEQASFEEESFASGGSDEYFGAAGGRSTSEQNTRSKRRNPRGASRAEQRTEGSAPETTVRVDQNRILNYLIDFHDGYCLVSDLRENHTLLEASLTPNAVVQALKRCKKVKVLINENNLDRSVVKAFIKSLRLCFQYKPPKPCANPQCHHLHLCKDFIMDCCFMKHCVCSHDVESQQNEAIMNDCGVHRFSPDKQLSLIRCANLMVCREHNGSEGCPDPDSCVNLHICNAFVMNKCLLLDDQCSEGHDAFTERNKKVLQLHEMDRLPIETIFKMLLTFRKQPQQNKRYAGNRSEAKEVKPANIQRRSEVEREEDETWVKILDEDEALPVQRTGFSHQNPNFMSFTEFMRQKHERSQLCDGQSKDICDAFEEHSCNLKANCTDRHKSLTPYLWRVKISGQWISLEKENSAIERAFSFPDIDEFWAKESIPDVPLRLDFNDMSSDRGPIQRLSTPSYVEIRDKVDTTAWLWYWHDGSQWIPYGQSGEPPHLDILEAKYQRDPQLICCFEFGSTLYELDFAKMEQKNLQTHFVRQVKRRPLYEDKVELATYRRLDVCHYDAKKLPSDWVPMDTESKDGTELIPLHSKSDAHKRVAAEFFKTMNKDSHQIRRIYKVQNLELWENYKTKKASVDKHMMGAETELHVFHGTAKEETTRWICGVGFDQRMQGVNGTVYGKGAYFATTAKYSHGYTQPSSRKLRYMFYAKITIGRMTLGNGDFKRPPPIDPNHPNKGLYDSCANNVTHPSIYVIFDNSQTYPDYLIEYRDSNPDPVGDQNALSQSQAYARAFNLSASNAATSQSTHVGLPSSPAVAYNRVPPPSNLPQWNSPSNPAPSNPTPPYPSSSNPLFNPPPVSSSMHSNPSSQHTTSQNSSTNSRPPKESSCLLM